MVTAAGGHDQELVLFYAAAVFVSFLAGLLAMSRFSWQDRRTGFLTINLCGTAAVGFTLAVNLTRGDPIVSTSVSVLIAAALRALRRYRTAPRHPQRRRASRTILLKRGRIRTAHFPAIKTVEDFNLDHLPSLRRDMLAHLATRTFVAKLRT